MNRALLTFLMLLGVATIASGQVWSRSVRFGAGQGTWMDLALASLSALLLVTSLLALGRIFYWTTYANQRAPDKEQSNGQSEP